jgi:hypothetical protein
MGLLDEAIREHLDLKRRRGADPTEVERLEREALGPVRRGTQESSDAMLDHDPATSVAYPEEKQGDWTEPLEDEPVAEESPAGDPFAGDRLAEREPEYDAPRHHEIAEEWHAHESLQAEQSGMPEGLHEPFPAEEQLPGEESLDEHQLLQGEGPGLEPDAHGPATPSPAPAAPPPDQPEHLSEETAEYDVEAEHREEREGEDVLEETPEFLQDTPDHDRLWFEQRPPKDFDFDG